MTRLLLALLVATSSASVAADSGWFGPKSYEDCVLENMKGVNLELAGRAVKRSCRVKFPQDCHAWKKRFDTYVETNHDKPWVKYGLAETSDPYVLSPKWGVVVPEECDAVVAK